MTLGVRPASTVDAGFHTFFAMSPFAPISGRVTTLVTTLGLVATLAAPVDGTAQEVRFSWSGFHSGKPELGFATGYGGGARFFLARGVGFGVDFDRLASSPAVRRTTCPEGVTSGPDCVVEPVDMATSGNFTTFLLLLGGMGDDWGLRVGFGRVAGTFHSKGEGRTTGRNGDVPSADTGAAPIAWSRGADGGVLVVELLRRSPVPGPFPLSLQAAFRRSGVRMSGCVVGEYSPFCGGTAISELQAGLHLGLRPIRRPR